MSMVQVSEGGVPVRNLFLRGASLYWRQQVRGRQVWQRIPCVARLRPGQSVTKDMIRRALTWMRDAETLALEHPEDFQGMRDEQGFRSSVVTIDKLLARYAEVCERLGDPRPGTVRNNSWALLRVVCVGMGLADTDAARQESTAVLTGELIERYAKAMLEDEDTPARRRSINHMLTQARGVLRKDLTATEYKGLRLPNLAEFMAKRGTKAPKARREMYSQAEVEAFRSGRELKESRPDLFVCWALQYYAALSASEVEEARTCWLREIAVTDTMREAGAWIGDRRTVWVLDLDADPEAELKNESRRGMVPLADDVAGELRSAACGGKYFLPGETPTERYNLSHKALSAWLRGKGLGRRHTTHELRAYRQQVWRDKYGDEVRGSWARHAQRSMGRAYTTQVVFSRRPLGLEE